MARQIEAIRAYSPRIKRGIVAELGDVVDFIAGRSSLNEGTILNVMAELREAITFYALSGRSVRLRGLGFFAPTIDLEGKLGINHWSDSILISEINVSGKFKGDIVNRDMIGKTTDDLVERWNQEHPNDKVKKN
ncbi:MAG: hypothetical protein JSV88_07590 [Candidatus Aminicenantes bacterium]|nr:MAG: hypothetical protein JSV88_07590 [Candidatus Aminicenantes bacterium]